MLYNVALKDRQRETLLIAFDFTVHEKKEKEQLVFIIP